MADSYRKRIINYLRDVTLQRITIANGFNHDIRRVKRGLLEVDAIPDSDFPILFIARTPEERMNITRNQFKSVIRLAIVGRVKNETGVDNTQEQLDNLIEDIVEALEYDRTLGGLLAKWLEVKSMATDDGDLAPHGVCVVTVEVVYVSEGVTA